MMWAKPFLYLAASVAIGNACSQMRIDKKRRNPIPMHHTHTLDPADFLKEVKDAPNKTEPPHKAVKDLFFPFL